MPPDHLMVSCPIPEPVTELTKNEDLEQYIYQLYATISECDSAKQLLREWANDK